MSDHDAQLVGELRALVAELLSAAPPEELLDATGAATLLGVPASWVLAEARADRIPHVRLGRYVRFHRGDLAAWAVSRSRGPRVRRRTGEHPVSDRRGPA